MNARSPCTEFHKPVLLGPIIAALAPRGGLAYLDGTFGAGGYSQALLEATECQVIAIDRDPAAVSLGLFFEEKYPGRFTLMKGRFSEMRQLLDRCHVDTVDGVALDLGVSSMQIDRPERGFSFQADGPLDMRMEQEGETAADVVNSRSEEELAKIFREYGEERRARRVATAIVTRRAERPITTTGDLSNIISRAVGAKRKSAASVIHPATRAFQALRIYVNREMEELRRGLEAAEQVLGEGGRLCVVSFHSLEDRIVKRFLRQRSGGEPGTSRHLPEGPGPKHAPTFTLPSRKAIRPDARELADNPRARSARLRVAVRTAAAYWPSDQYGENNERVMS